MTDLLIIKETLSETLFPEATLKEARKIGKDAEEHKLNFPFLYFPEFTQQIFIGFPVYTRRRAGYFLRMS